MSKKVEAYYKTPIGTAKIVGTIEGVESITLLEKEQAISTDIPSILQKCVIQLDEYFAGKRIEFTLKLNPKGTSFQKKVWQELTHIPLGKAITYLQQAKKLGDVKAIRAVAAANGKNPIWIVIPCHRVIGSNGLLTGYAGGIWRKKWLLEHEGFLKQQSLF